MQMCEDDVSGKKSPPPGIALRRFLGLVYVVFAFAFAAVLAYHVARGEAGREQWFGPAEEEEEAGYAEGEAEGEAEG